MMIFFLFASFKPIESRKPANVRHPKFYRIERDAAMPYLSRTNAGLPYLNYKTLQISVNDHFFLGCLFSRYITCSIT